MLREMLDAWMKDAAVEGAAFQRNDPVRVIRGPHAGASGATTTLLALEPASRYRVALASGEEIEADETDLASVHVGAPDHPLSVLQHWYARQTDGDWEHSYGIRIETLDNPGWLVDVDLTDTELAERPFAEVSETQSECDWLMCRVRDGKFEARGGPFMLDRMLQVFADWVQTASATPRSDATGDTPPAG